MTDDKHGDLKNQRTIKKERNCRILTKYRTHGSGGFVVCNHIYFTLSLSVHEYARTKTPGHETSISGKGAHVRP